MIHPMYEVRKAQNEDAVHLRQLFNTLQQEKQKLDPSIHMYVILLFLYLYYLFLHVIRERSILSLTVATLQSPKRGSNQKGGSIVAFASFIDAAPIPNVLSSAWELWLAENYDTPNINVCFAAFILMLYLQTIAARKFSVVGSSYAIKTCNPNG